MTSDEKVYYIWKKIKEINEQSMQEKPSYNIYEIEKLNSRLQGRLDVIEPILDILGRK